MKIGVNGRFLGAVPGGVQRFGREVLRRLAEGAEVVLLLPRGVTPPPDLRPVRVVSGFLSGPLWEQLELPTRARRAGAQVVLNPANAAPLWGGPNIVVLHDLAPFTRPDAFRPAYRVWARLAHGEAARRAAAVVTVSRWSADEIARLLGVPRNEIDVVGQGAAPLDSPASREAVAAVRRRHGIEGPFFLAVTGDDPRKGADTLLEAWRGWVASADPLLVIVGSHSHRVHPRRATGSPIRVRRVGRVPDEELRALYTGSVALLHASSLEGFGRPPLEALACGTRVVTAPYGAIREILGDACDVVDRDPARWRAAVERLLAEDAVTRARRIAAGKSAAARWGWDDSARALLEICRCAAGARA